MRYWHANDDGGRSIHPTVDIVDTEMTSSLSLQQRSLTEDALGETGAESWVEVNGTSTPSSPTAATTAAAAADADRSGLPAGGVAGAEDYLRLLREAQRDGSNQSSALVSLASTRKNSPHGSPKSPPNSPNTEPAGEGDELKGIYINYHGKEDAAVLENTTDWVWDWSSRPDQQPPKEWKFVHPSGASGGIQRKPYGYSIRFAKVGGTSVFSRQVLYTVVITNLLSLLLGTGIGFWLSRRSIQVLHISVD